MKYVSIYLKRKVNMKSSLFAKLIFVLDCNLPNVPASSEVTQR